MGSRPRIILAEDHILVREGTRAILESTGEIDVVGEASDGEEAVEMVLRLRPDVAIVDLGLPRLNGIEVIRRIKAALPEVGVLALTVHEEDEYVMAAIEAGAAGYLLKDVAGQTLVDGVRSVFAGESVLHPTIARRVFARIARGRGHPPVADEQSLTAREMDVLRLAASGRSNQEIAGELGLSVRTVQTHLVHVFKKLGVASRTEAVVFALRRGWLALEELR